MARTYPCHSVETSRMWLPRFDLWILQVPFWCSKFHRFRILEFHRFRILAFPTVVFDSWSAEGKCCLIFFLGFLICRIVWLLWSCNPRLCLVDGQYYCLCKWSTAFSPHNCKERDPLGLSHRLCLRFWCSCARDLWWMNLTLGCNMT